MQIDPLSIDGSWLIRPQVFGDSRGHFLEWFKAERFEQAIGRRFDLKQANGSVSARGALRGVHFADTPPGQAKYISCVSGSILDIVVDVRVGSPTFGKYAGAILDAKNRHAVYISEGLGHAFLSLEDDSSVIYLCNEPYRPANEHGINPLDPELAIPWRRYGINELLLSEKDTRAPSLHEAAEAGLLPDYATCRDHVESCRLN